MGFFERLKQGLKKTKESIFGQVGNIFKHFTKVDEDMLEELEEVLIASDVGVTVTETVIEKLRESIKEKHINEPEEARTELIAILEEVIGENEGLKLDTKPAVIFVIGVNGVGKTTTIAKLANLLKQQGKSVALAAADTFRAAAIDQLEIWAERVGVPVIKHTEGSDPAAVVFDAASYVKSHGTDVLIVDTAGRLHVKKNLMDELAKIGRVLERELPGCDRENLLVLDAVTGQNAINQAKEFMSAADITGIVLTKLDGTAKGGVIISVKSELGIPVKFIGVGEQMDDLQPFDRAQFVAALFDEKE
ncbi:MAG: signal recognition particle-docking protein FtsY [Eubacteriales bacterium]